jgi:hypothetical protein
MKTLCGFFSKDRLLNWFRSVLAYCEQSADCSANSRLHSVRSAFEDVAAWASVQYLQIKVEDGSFGLTESIHPIRNKEAMALWGSEIAATVWLTGIPKHIATSMAAFMLARTLYEYTDSHKTSIKDIVRSLADMAAIDKGESSAWRYANLGHGYRDCFPEMLALHSAVQQYRAALVCLRRTTEIAHMRYLLSAALRTVFEQNGSITALNESIELAEEILKMAIDDPADMAIYRVSRTRGRDGRFEERDRTG